MPRFWILVLFYMLERSTVRLKESLGDARSLPLMPDLSIPLVDENGAILPQEFSLADNMRLIRHLRINFSQRAFLFSQIGGTLQSLAYIQERQEYVALIVGILDELDQLLVLRSQQGTDAQSTLIRADVLEWQPGGQVASVQARQGELRRELAMLLNCEWLLGGGGSAMVLRS